MIATFPKLSPLVKLDSSPGGGGSAGIFDGSAAVSGFMLDIALPKGSINRRQGDRTAGQAKRD